MKLTHVFLPKGLLCLFICFISTTVVYGQNNDFQHKKDSLLKVIASTQGEEKLKAYEAWARLQLNTQIPEEEIDLTLQYINEFIHETRKQQNKKYESMAYQAELVCLSNSLKYEERYQKANEYLPFFKKNGDYRYYYDTHEMLLRNYMNSVSYKYSIGKIRQIYEEAKQENCLFGIVKMTLLIAHLYEQEHRYEDSEKYAQETIKNALKLIKEEPNQIANYYLLSDGYYSLSLSLLNQNKLNELLSLMSDWKKNTINFEKVFGFPDPSLVNYYRFCADIYIKKGKYDEAELYCDSMEPIIRPLESLFLWGIKVDICKGRKEYDKAIDYINKIIDMSINIGEINSTANQLAKKAYLLREMGHAEEAFSVYEKAYQLNDSIRLAESNTKLDEVRTQYEVDKYIAEKERQRIIIFSLIGGCILLAILLGGWIHYSRKVTQKNRILAQQIKELTAQQEEQIKEMLAKTSFLSHSPDETLSIESDKDKCDESRMDKLCIGIRDFLFKDKIYRDSTITSESVAKKLGTNKNTFAEVMNFCFNMSFSDYVNVLRLKDAVLYLEQTNLSIEEISYRVGFGTERTFYNQFSKKYGMTPNNYRISAKKIDSHPEHSEGPPAQN